MEELTLRAMQHYLDDVHPCVFRHLVVSTQHIKPVVIFRKWRDSEQVQQLFQLHKEYSRKLAFIERNRMEQNGKHTKQAWEQLSQGFILYELRSKHWARSTIWITLLLSFNHARKSALQKHCFHSVSGFSSNKGTTNSQISSF